MAYAGDYVQIHSVILRPGERAPQVPEDTQKVPLELRIKGFLDHDARLGDEVTITTVLGRKVAGRLVAVNPAYPHNFGRPVPELLHVGEESWRLLGMMGGGKGEAP
ncbi:MAG: 2-amino-4-oxopentanoate thiolase subunit OrtA [Bacillota bacterium]